MKKEIKINEVYTLTVGDLDGMLNDFLSDLGVDEDAITQDQVEQLAAKLIDRFLFESDPSKWPLKDNSLPKTLQICPNVRAIICDSYNCECKPKV